MQMTDFENPDNPFSTEILLTPFYSNKLIEQFFSVLVNSIGGKDFLILVIGEFHSGKTTLLNKLTSQHQDNVISCHLKIRESDDPLSENSNRPAFLYKTENSQVIILDDAHQLNIHELSIILKNAWDSNKEIKQLILFCEPQINSILSSLLKRMPKKTSVNKLYLPSFDKKQTESYLNHYLKEADLKDQFSFSKINVKNIYKNSKGLPGKINLEAEQIFSKKKVAKTMNQKSKSKFSPILTYTIVIFFLCAIACFAIYKTYTPSLFSSNKNLSEKHNKTITKTIEPIYQNDKPEVAPTPEIEQKTNQEVILTTTITENNISTTDPIISSPTQPDKPDPNIIKSQPKKTVVKPKALEKTTISSTINSVIFQEEWIMDQNPLMYTIQVMAAKEKDSVSRFLTLNGNNQNQVAYYKMYSKNGLWYKFISGKFETFEKAKAACQNLPEKLKNLGPWPRQFESIQKDIVKHKDN